uniref:Uncharacterized protein n=1 Tax=Zea mays TaxID=4577 RepID=A0A804U9V8_MAIZE
MVIEMKLLTTTKQQKAHVYKYRQREQASSGVAQQRRKRENGEGGADRQAPRARLAIHDSRTNSIKHGGATGGWRRCGGGGGGGRRRRPAWAEERRRGGVAAVGGAGGDGVDPGGDGDQLRLLGLLVGAEIVAGGVPGGAQLPGDGVGPGQGGGLVVGPRAAPHAAPRRARGLRRHGACRLRRPVLLPHRGGVVHGRRRPLPSGMAYDPLRTHLERRAAEQLDIFKEMVSLRVFERIFSELLYCEHWTTHYVFLQDYKFILFFR